MSSNSFSSNHREYQQRGELNFVDKTQGSCIANCDESALTMDDANTAKEGNPVMVFLHPKLANDPTHAAHKHGFHCTLLAGMFASGEKFQEQHYQLASDKKDEDRTSGGKC